MNLFLLALACSPSPDGSAPDQTCADALPAVAREFPEATTGATSGDLDLEIGPRGFDVAELRLEITLPIEAAAISTELVLDGEPIVEQVEFYALAEWSPADCAGWVELSLLVRPPERAGDRSLAEWTCGVVGRVATLTVTVAPLDEAYAGIVATSVEDVRLGMSPADSAATCE